jgi:hypothetical protein
MTSFFTPRDPEQDTAVGSVVSHSARSAVCQQSPQIASDLTYADQCAALALYIACKERYLADVDAVEGDPCFWTAMGGIEFQRGNT